MEHITINDKINNYLLVVKKQTGDNVNVSKIAEDLDVPYKRNISGVLVNLSLIKWNSKGNYTVTMPDVTELLVEQVIMECRNTAKAYNKSSRKTNAPTVSDPVKKDTISQTPFGFDSFDTIMVEKGKIIIGDYTLEGNFTITKNE